MPVLIAGAVIGVLVVLGSVLAVIGKLDARYLTRLEAVPMLEALTKDVAEIKADLKDHLRGAG